MLRALEFIVSMIRESAQRTAPGFPCERFNDDESRSRPIRFAIELGGVMNLSPEIQKRIEAKESVEQGVYRYELELDVEDEAAHRISHEALRQKPDGHGKWQRVFDRDRDGKVKGSRFFPMSGYHHLLNTLRPNVSVLSSFSMFQHPIATLFVQWAQNAIFRVGSVPDNEPQIVRFIKEQPEILERLNKELRRIDVGVEAMRFVDTPTGPAPVFEHFGLQLEMPWLLESHGTRSFIKMFPGIALSLLKGGLFAIDELDAAIHPLVLSEIIRWFHDRNGRNRHDAQLWFSCHSVSLLEELEIVICEKDRHGRTTFHRLMDVKVRRDDNHRRKYLSGVYGGVPRIG